MPFTSWPWMLTVPPVGCSKPAIRRRHVVLPEPDGPSMAKNSRSLMSKLTSSTAFTTPKCRATLRNETATEFSPPERFNEAMIPLKQTGGHRARPSVRLTALLSALDAVEGFDPALVVDAGLAGAAILDRRLPEVDLVEQL